MANLPQGDRTVITKYPLDDSLDHLQDSLQKAEQSYGPNSIAYNGGNTRD
jgi:hypothetical protein